MVGPEVEPRIILGDLISYLVPSSLSVLLQLLAIRDPLGSILTEVRSAADARPRTDAGPWSTRSRAGNRAAGWQRRRTARSGVAQEVGRRAASAGSSGRAAADGARRRTRDIEKVVQITGGRSPAAGDTRTCAAGSSASDRA